MTPLAMADNRREAVVTKSPCPSPGPSPSPSPSPLGHISTIVTFGHCTHLHACLSPSGLTTDVRLWSPGGRRSSLAPAKEPESSRRRWHGNSSAETLTKYDHV